MSEWSQKYALPPVAAEEDCIPGAPVFEEDEQAHEAGWRGVADQKPAASDWPWASRPRISGRRLPSAVEGPVLALESLVNRLIGAQALNPFYHTGTIAVFLMIVVAVTGLYLTIFYVLPGVGTAHAYEAVAAIDGHWLGIGRIMRGVHRYASGAAVIATLFHALRTLFQDRFRGARWLAWFSGMLMLAVLWLEGASGYWLVWDERAQLILETVVSALKTFPSVGVPYALNFLTNEATDQVWLFFLILLFAHIALFAVAGLFYWLHVLRLSRAKFLPPRHLMIALGLMLAAAALIWPATSAAKADLARLPGAMTIDPFFLVYLPATLRANPAIFWGVVLAVFGLVTAVPWLFRGNQPGRVVVDKDLCNGCTRCAEDCPYSAIQMLPRTDGKPHKLVAIENPSLCVSCGVCVGSCDGMAVSLTDLPVTPYYGSMLARIRAARSRAGGPVRVVFTCERHAAHGARRWQSTGDDSRRPSPVTIAVPCVGALHPNVVGQAVGAGAEDVVVIGCPLDDCAQREGSLWIGARLNRTRLPRLRREYVGLPIRTAWLPPNESAAGMAQPAKSAQNGAPAGPVAALRPAHLLRGGLLLAIALAVQVALTDAPYRPFAENESLLQLGMRGLGQPREHTASLTGPELAQLPHEQQVQYLNQQQAEGRFPTRLRLEVDGRVILDQSYRAQGFHREGSSFALEKFILAPGEHSVRLSLDDAGGELVPVLEKSVTFSPGQIHTITLDRVTNTFELK